MPSILPSAAGAVALVAAGAGGSGRTAGQNGLTSSVSSATASPARRFGTPRLLAKGGRRHRQSLSAAAAASRVALAWRYKADSRHVGVEATVGRPGSLGAPRTIASSTLVDDFTSKGPTRGSPSRGPVPSPLAVLPTQPAPGQLAGPLLAIDGL